MNAIYAVGRLPGARTLWTFCCTFGIPLWYMDNEDDEERIRRLATLDTHGCLPTSWSNDDPCSPWDSGHYAVHLSLRGRSRQLTRLWNFFQLGFQLLSLCHIPRCFGEKKHMAYWAEPQIYDLMLVSAHVRPSPRIRTASNNTGVCCHVANLSLYNATNGTTMTCTYTVVVTTYLCLVATCDRTKHSGHLDQWRKHSEPAHTLIVCVWRAEDICTF